MLTIYDNGWEYDALGMGQATVAEAAFYRSQLPETGGSMLELACGTGRLTIPLAEAGIKIVGIDNSPAMLAVAREKAAQVGAQPIFVEADIRAFMLDEKFDVIFLPNNSLGHLHTLSDIQGCLVSTKRHLNAKGRFVVHMFNPSLALLTRPSNEEYPIAEYDAPDGHGNVTVTQTAWYDAATQISRAVWRYRRNGVLLSERELDMRIFFPQELDALLTLAGFVIEAKYGDSNGVPFTSQASQQLIVCKSS